jgi:hypothetical protein
MRTLLLLLLTAWPVFGAPRWIGWTVPTHGDHTVVTDGVVCTSHEFLLALRMENDRIERVRLLNPKCHPGLDGLDVEIRQMTPEASLEFLSAHLAGADDVNQLITAIALHDHPNVVPKLIALARNDPRREVRRQSLFWLGQRAGEKAAGELRRAVDDDPDEEVREHAVFAISQLPRDKAVPMLIELVKTHKSRRVRERAMFWLAQTDDPRALELIE